MGSVEETGLPRDDLDAIACELRLRHVDFGFDDLVDAKAQVGHGDLFFDVIVDAVDALELEAREMQHGLAHGLAGNGAGIDADAADDFALLNDGDLPPAFRALDSCTLS